MRKWSLAVTCVLTWVCLCSFGFAYAQEQPTASAEVIVIGAGFAGLCAADRLVEEGVDVILLEKEARVGGKLLSVPLGGEHPNLGAQYVFYGGHPRMSAYMDQLPLFIPEGDEGALWDGQFVTGADDMSLILNLPMPQSAKLDLLLAQVKMELDHALIAVTRESFVDKEPEFPLWMSVEGQSAAQYLSGFHPDVARIFDFFLAGEGGAGVEDATALVLVGGFAGEGGGRLFVQGGNQGLAEFVKEGFLQAGGRLFLSCEVAQVTETGDKVYVQSSDGRLFESDYAVVATPAHVTKEIVQGLTLAKLEALEATRYNPMGLVALHLACLPTGERLWGVGFFEGEGVDINAYIDQTVPSGGNGGTETVISAIIAGDEAALNLNDADLVQRVAANIQKVDPEFDPDSCILDYAVKRWFRGTVDFPPGFLSQYQEALREPLGRIHFAGDYTYDGALSGAAWSGVRAAEQVLGIEPPAPCFIATASFGTAMAEKTAVLARFRDTYLQYHPTGKWFIKTYYKYGPPVADFIADRAWLRALVRVLLMPLVGFVSLLV
jgi:monoamine oxidase